MNARYDVVVVGAGLNGLVAGAYLAARRTSVLILDQRPMPGGAAITTEFAPGFRAPTLSHALGPIAADVLRALDLDAASLDLVAPDPALVALDFEGRAIAFSTDTARTAASIATLSPDDADRWPAFVSAMARLGAVAESLAATPPPPLDDPSLGDLWPMLGVGLDVRRLSRDDLARALRYGPMAVADLAAEWFSHPLLRAAIAARALTGNQDGPRSAGTGGYFLQHLAADAFPLGSGVTARGGPGALSRRLARLAADRGATLVSDARVSRVDVDAGRVRGVTLDDGRSVEAAAVLAAVDPRTLFLSLVTPDALPPSFVARMRNYRARGATAKINLALSGTPDCVAGRDALAGRMLVAPDLDHLERAHDAAKYGDFSPEPWLEIAIPTLVDPSLAPAGRHVLSIYAHVAPSELRHRDWTAARDDFERAAMTVLDRVMPGVERLVIGRELITPADLERRWGLSGGHIFHGEPAMDQTWVARPTLGWARYATPVSGLYLGGAGAHPGGGLTGRPGLLAARAVSGER